MSTSPRILHAPAALWDAARNLLTSILDLFGAPEAIAARFAHTKDQHDLLLKWLRAGEAMVRHLLLIEAAAYADLPVAPTRPRKPRESVRRQHTFDPAKPESWRVSFRCADSSSKQRSRSRRAITPRRFYPALPLAKRAEAMLRAYQNPAPYAKRLARRFRVRPQSMDALVRVVPHLAHVIDRPVYVELREATHVAYMRFESG